MIRLFNFDSVFIFYDEWKLTMDFMYYVNYFAMLEERLISLQKYIAFEEENLNVFSIECASIINDCCGLINGFCFELCQTEKPNKKKFNMSDYKNYILNNFQKNELVYCGKFIIQPWEELLDKDIKTPLWWNDYNDIKHSGKSNFSKATLKNVISCMAGMFSLLVMLDYKRMGCTMCNWRGLFSDAGNYKKEVSWKC